MGRGQLRSLFTGVAWALFAFGAATPSHAVSFLLDPFPTDLAVGDTFDLDVTVSGFGDGTSPSLASGQFSLGFTEAGVLGVTDVTFGSALGPGSAQSFSVDPFGALFSEATALSFADLDAAQPDTFVWATLSFEAVGQGTTLVTGRPAKLITTSKLSNPIGISKQNVEVSAVPLPGAFFLVLSALAGVGSFARFAGRRPARAGMAAASG